MRFQVFLPASIAGWLNEKIRTGTFQNPAEAAFVAIQDLVELYRHPEVRLQLLRAMVQDGIGEPGDTAHSR
jgi:Arc/MetJ-type ribon-helix-helix transcriptional regulator